jgi:hypothetical protein
MARTSRPMITRDSVQVLGLRELVADLRAMDKRMGDKNGLTALNKELKAAADIVADEARRTAAFAGMVGMQPRRLDRDGNPYGKPRKRYRPGRTVRSIRGTSVRNEGVVQVRAKGTGQFPYPFAYEFGAWSGRGPSNPRREFLYPAIYNKQDEVMETLAEGLTRIMREYWQDTTGRPGGIQIG